VKTLADYTITRHYPEASQAANPYLELFRGILQRQAKLMAQWLAVGFIHGVMNTDNMALSGESIDFGPCAFLDTYNPKQVFSSIDHNGRYAFGNQPNIAQWNLARLSECLMPLMEPDETQAVEFATMELQAFIFMFKREYLLAIGQKIGFANAQDDDAPLCQGLLTRMHSQQEDYTHFFRNLPQMLSAPKPPEQYGEWAQNWHDRQARSGEKLETTYARMMAANPVYIPRNAIVEEVLQAASTQNDLAPLEKLLEALQHPYTERPGLERYAAIPQTPKIPHKTYCGT
jgi:serine/tyrosine/threonine adenylyltransferase